MAEFEDLRSLVRRAFESYNRGDLEAYNGFYADPVTLRDPATQETRRVTREQGIAGDASFRRVFSDHTCVIDHMIVEGGLVFVRYVNHATHSGATEASLRTFGPPTGKRVTWAGSSEYRIDDGIITEVTVLNDTLGLLVQLGVIEWPPANPPTS